MEKLACISLLLLLACGGSLSDEQRKRLHEGMDRQKIMKVDDSEIVTASLDHGRAIFEGLEKINFSSSQIDSIAHHHHVRIKWLATGSSQSLEVEQQMIEAYVIGAETGLTQDNIQPLRRSEQSMEYDSLLYSRPVMTTMPDSVVRVDGVWNIYISKKEVILLLGEER